MRMKTMLTVTRFFGFLCVPLEDSVSPGVPFWFRPVWVRLGEMGTCSRQRHVLLLLFLLLFLILFLILLPSREAVCEERKQAADKGDKERASRANGVLQNAAARQPAQCIKDIESLTADD